MSYMDDRDKDIVISKYVNRYQKFGIDVATLNSGGSGKQYIRHSVHTSMFDLAGKHVLDVGCGIAMFYEFLRHKSIPIASYTGIDIMEIFIESNKQRFPEASFHLVDIFKDSLEPYQTDVVFMSQVFNHRYDFSDNEVVAKEAINRLFQIARVGLVIDFMTSYVDYNEDYLYYFSPEKMFGYAKSLTRLAAIRHDYLPFEFSLFLYKQPTYDLAEATQRAQALAAPSDPSAGQPSSPAPDESRPS